MATDEEWKGKHLISAKGANNRKEATRMVNVIYHAKRRAEGAPTPGAKEHRGIMRSILSGMAGKR